jgi:hypothetical protein
MERFASWQTIADATYSGDQTYRSFSDERQRNGN